jgi:putative ABC transport system permease protein
VRRLRAWALRLAGAFTRGRRMRELDAELHSHLEMHIEHNIRGGMTAEDARRHALIAAGGLQAARDAYRDRTGVPALESLAQDVRFAFRMLRKAPGFTAAAVLVLALGIGVNGAMFSLINALLLRPIVPGSPELVGVYSGSTARPDAFRPFSFPEFVDIRERNGAFDELVAESPLRTGITENGVTTSVPTMLVSSNYFRALGIRMAAGRAFSLDEERPASRVAVAVVSDAYWRRHGRTPDIIGRRLMVNNRPLTIVGVAPERFHGTMPVMSTELWLPFGAAAVIAGDGLAATRAVADDRDVRTLLLAGTLKRGLSIEEANARLAPVAAALAAAYPQYNRDQALLVQTRSRTGRGPQPRRDNEPAIAATLLMAISGLVLLVACLNLANMQLARGSVRRQEIAVRLALGGGRARIVRQLVIEGLLLSVFATVAALAFGWWAAARFLAAAGAVAGTPIVLDVSPDARVLAALAAACFVSTLLFALGPAWKLSGPDLVSSLKPGVPFGSRARRARLPGLLVAGQVALSLALLVAAGAFARAAANAASADPGFALEGGILATIDPRLAGFSEDEGRAALGEVLERIRALPEVRAASAASIVPLGSFGDGRVITAGERTAFATFTVIGARYFDALGLPVLSGREFTGSEEASAPGDPVAIVDRTLAERLFGEQPALGQLLQIVEMDESTRTTARIVGIVPPVRHDLGGPPDPHIYVPSGRHYRSPMTIHVRTGPGREAAMFEPIREAIRNADAQLPLLSVMTLRAHRDATATLQVMLIAVRGFATFGTVALLLAVAGVYGLRAYLVAQRTRELGIRIALGATRGRVVGELVRDGARVAAAGIGGGLLLAVGLVQLLRQAELLFEVRPLDPVILAGASFALAAAVAAATYIPARRAVRVDPAVALRPE